MRALSCIVVYGRSLFITALVAALRERDALCILHYAAPIPHLVPLLVAFAPDLVLAEQGAIEATLCLPLLEAGIPVLLLDAQRAQGQLLHTKAVAIQLTDHTLQVVDPLHG